MPIILDIPFDEAPGSNIAFDYSLNERHGYVKGGGVSFVPGKENYGIKFSDGEGYLKIKYPPPFINGDHTMMFWYRSDTFIKVDTLRFQYAVDEIIKPYYDRVFPDYTWFHIAVTRSGTGNFRIYINGVFEHEIVVSGGIIRQWAIFQGHIYDGVFENYEKPPTPTSDPDTYGYGTVDSLKIFDEVLSPEEIKKEMLGTARERVWWSVNGLDFIENWSVYVSESKGLIENMNMKEQMSYDWKEYHGKQINLDRWRMEERTIELECFIKSNGKVDFVMKLTDFLSQFQKPGLQRLKCEISEHKPLVWEVYMPSQTDLEKKWRDQEMFGTFTLTFADPNPVRRVVRFAAKPGSMTCHISIKCPGVVSIFWGDGTSTEEIITDVATTITHTYTESKIYQAIVACEPDDITYWWSNGITIWNRL